MIDRLFLAHPRDVNESYGEHWRVANRFGWQMVVAGFGCVIHGFVPAVFTRTGSSMVKKLYGEMKQRQPTLGAQPPAFADKQWLPEYEI